MIEQLPPNFLQSKEWAKANELVGHAVLTEKFGKNINYMIVKSAKRGRYLEIPGGPVLNWDDEKEVTKAFARIRELAAEHKCAFVRLRPQLLKTEENLAILASVGAVKAPMHLHAEHTVIIDLTKSEEDLLAAMRRQTRYEVRRAGKLGITVTSGNSKELFREFHAVQADTAARQHFVPPSLKTLLAEREAFGDDAQIYIASTSEKGGTKPDLVSSAELSARGGKLADSPISGSSRQRERTRGLAPVTTGGQPGARDSETANLPGNAIAYGLIIRHDDEAEYFEAASTKLNRKLPGAYALQWQVIKDLKKQGVKRYNLWGIAPPGAKNHRYSGVTTFKTGFGGDIVEFVPAHDIIISPARYKIDLAVEKLRKKRRKL